MRKKGRFCEEDDAVAILLLSHFDQPGITYIVRRRELPVTLGSSQEADIRLHDNFISPLHARIEMSGEIWTLCNLATNAGTYVNGCQVADAPLANGDQITLGRTSLRVHISLQPQPRKKTPQKTQQISLFRPENIRLASKKARHE